MMDAGAVSDMPSIHTDSLRSIAATLAHVADLLDEGETDPATTRDPLAAAAADLDQITKELTT